MTHGFWLCGRTAGGGHRGAEVAVPCQGVGMLCRGLCLKPPLLHYKANLCVFCCSFTSSRDAQHPHKTFISRGRGAGALLHPSPRSLPAHVTCGFWKAVGSCRHWRARMVFTDLTLCAKCQTANGFYRTSIQANSLPFKKGCSCGNMC